MRTVVGPAHGLFQQRPDDDRLKRHLQPSAIDGGEIDQVLNQAVEPAVVVQDPLQEITNAMTSWR
jgi:hypothetical protein